MRRCSGERYPSTSAGNPAALAAVAAAAFVERVYADE